MVVFRYGKQIASSNKFLLFLVAIFYHRKTNSIRTRPLWDSPTIPPPDPPPVTPIAHSARPGQDEEEFEDLTTLKSSQYSFFSLPFPHLNTYQSSFFVVGSEVSNPPPLFKEDTSASLLKVFPPKRPTLNED